MCRRSAAVRLLLISRKQSPSSCASADKLGDGVRHGLGLLQQQKMSRTRQVDNPNALAQLLAQRMSIPRRRRFIVEPLDHEKGGSAGAPPIFDTYVPAGREMRDKGLCCKVWG
jgi:hypothetical protein